MNDLVWVFVFFLIMLLVRSIMTMIFYPYLAKLGYGNLGTTNPLLNQQTNQPTTKLTKLSRPLPGTSPKDAAFMVWAGLRGAVGLALALVVSQSGGDQRHGKQGQ